MKRALIVALSGLVATAVTGCKKEAPAGAPPEVYVADVVQKDVPVYLELVGQTRGFQDVEIRARVEGYLDRVAFTEGTFVSKGTLLYQIDPLPLAGGPRQREGATSRRPRRGSQKTDHRRQPPDPPGEAAGGQPAGARQRAVRPGRGPRPGGRQQGGGRQGDARPRLHAGSPRRSTASWARPQVKAGNLVGRGESTLLTTVSQVDPILFRAGVSEAEYLRIAKRVLEDGGLKATRQKAEIELLLADGTVHPHKGTPRHHRAGGRPDHRHPGVQFTFPNPERLVRPGQYGRVRFVIETKAGALLVPQRAVTELQNLYSLAVVGAGNKVEFRNVKVGPRVDGLWLIEEGLKPGEKVVVEGLQKVRDGMVVSPKPAAAAPAGKGASEPATEAK